MKVVLLQKVAGLGDAGSVAEVKDGYGRNYLLPKNLAVSATEANLKRQQMRERIELARKEKFRKEAGTLRDKLVKLSLTITAKAGPDDKLFGSVTDEDIVRALTEQSNLRLDKSQVILEEPIRELGIFKVSINLIEDMSAELKIWVVRDKV